MSLLVIIKIALRGLLANKLRSFLTMLGVIIGVGAVIAMLAIGEGAKRQVTRQIESLGVTTLTVRPGLRGMAGAKLSESERLTLEDAEAIARDLPDVVAVAPEVAGTAEMSFQSNSVRTRVVGTTEAYLSARSFRIDRGRMFDGSDDAALRQYCVLGAKVVEDLFPAGTDPVGASIKIRGKFFTVVGTMAAKGDQGFYNPDNQAYIPLQVAGKRVFGVTAGAAGSLQSIHVQVDGGGPDVSSDGAALAARMSAAERRLEMLIRQRHKIAAGEPSDFYIRNMAEYLRQIEETSRTFTVLLGSVAGISLVVGGIGIMNIMLVTVTERTREIGIRKALGARPWDILKQFVIEATVVSTLGGLLGIGVGLGAAHLIPIAHQYIPNFPKFETAPTASSVIVSFAFAAGIGIFFGFYPARKAASMDPIEALRYE